MRSRRACPELVEGILHRSSVNRGKPRFSYVRCQILRLRRVRLRSGSSCLYRRMFSQSHLESCLMFVFEWTILVLLAAIVLSAIARRLGVPYPAFLALGGATV